MLTRNQLVGKKAVKSLCDLSWNIIFTMLLFVNVKYCYRWFPSRFSDLNFTKDLVSLVNQPKCMQYFFFYSLGNDWKPPLETCLVNVLSGRWQSISLVMTSDFFLFQAAQHFILYYFSTFSTSHIQISILHQSFFRIEAVFMEKI